MKLLAFVACLAVSGGVFAQDVVSVTWRVLGLVDEYVTDAESAPVDSLELDLRVGGYVTANGAVRTDDNVLFPATGTCFSLLGGGVWCELAVRQVTYAIEIDMETLGGTLTVINQDGFSVDGGTLVFQSIR